MKRLAYLPKLICLLCISACGQPAGTDMTATDSHQGAAFKRTALMVADIDRALTLYRDALGLTVDEITRSSPESFGYATFKVPPAARFRFAALTAGAQVRTLGLAEVQGIELPALPAPHRSAVVFRVPDMAAAVAQIKALGLELGPSNIDVTSDGVHFVEQPLVDFDGHLVLLYQLMPEGG